MREGAPAPLVGCSGLMLVQPPAASADYQQVLTPATAHLRRRKADEILPRNVTFLGSEYRLSPSRSRSLIFHCSPATRDSSSSPSHGRDSLPKVRSNEQSRSFEKFIPHLAKMNFAIRRATEADAERFAEAHRHLIDSIGARFYPREVVADRSARLAGDLYAKAMAAGETFYIAVDLISRALFIRNKRAAGRDLADIEGLAGALQRDGRVRHADAVGGSRLYTIWTTTPSGSLI